MTETCLVLIKPDGISRGLSSMILQHIERSGLTVVHQKVLTATEDQCRRHYNIKARNYGATEKQIVDYLSKSYVKNENLCAIIVEGEKAIDRAYEIKIYIRDNFTLDTLEKCAAEGRAWHNIMHSSESVEDAEKEIAVWLR